MTDIYNKRACSKFSEYLQYVLRETQTVFFTCVCVCQNLSLCVCVCVRVCVCGHQTRTLNGGCSQSSRRATVHNLAPCTHIHPASQTHHPFSLPPSPPPSLRLTTDSRDTALGRGGSNQIRPPGVQGLTVCVFVCV